MIGVPTAERTPASPGGDTERARGIGDSCRPGADRPVSNTIVATFFPPRSTGCRPESARLPGPRRRRWSTVPSGS